MNYQSVNNVHICGYFDLISKYSGQVEQAQLGVYSWHGISYVSDNAFWPQDSLCATCRDVTGLASSARHQCIELN